MAVIHAAARRALKSSQFALPGKRGYPIPDEEHGRKAVQMAPHASPSEQATIKRKVHEKFPDIQISRPGKRVLGRKKGDSK